MQMDPQLQSLLTARVSVWRPMVELSPDMAPMAAAYERVRSGVACAVQPVPGGAEVALTGATARAGAVVYLATGMVSPGDRLALRRSGSVLAADATAGDGALELAESLQVDGELSVVVGGGADAELVGVVGATEGGLELSAALRRGHLAGDAVELVELLEVQSAIDEAGLGHHVRAVAGPVVC